MVSTLRVISGGQTGVDIAGLRAAKAAGVETGGWMPKGWRTDGGAHPEYAALYGLRVTRSEAYPVRTRKNVASADHTLLIGTDLGSAGSRTTLRACAECGKMCTRLLWQTGRTPDATVFEALLQLLVRQEPFTLNVAGNRDPKLEKPVEEWLTTLFREAARLRDANEPAPLTLSAPAAATSERPRKTGNRRPARNR